MAEVVGGSKEERKRGRHKKRDKRKRQRESLEWDPCEAGAQVLKLILLNGCRNRAAETGAVSAHSEGSEQSRVALPIKKVIITAVKDLCIVSP